MRHKAWFGSGDAPPPLARDARLGVPPSLPDCACVGRSEHLQRDAKCQAPARQARRGEAAREARGPRARLSLDARARDRLAQLAELVEAAELLERLRLA